MQAVDVARAFLLAALFLFLVGDLASLALRIAGGSGHETRHSSPTSDLSTSRQVSQVSSAEKLARFTSAVKNSCLPKLICELNASPEKDKLTAKAKSLLQLIRDTSISMTADASSRYHFAAHMGQLISGVDGTGCHNFYPSCPLPSVKVLSLLNKPSLF